MKAEWKSAWRTLTLISDNCGYAPVAPGAGLPLARLSDARGY
jgi:hypothetical protein